MITDKDRDFSFVKMGDKVFTASFGWGTVDSITMCQRVFHVKGDGDNSDCDGTYSFDQTVYIIPKVFWNEPEITVPKRKVVKTVERWGIMVGSIFTGIWETDKGAVNYMQGIPDAHLVKLTGTYEVME